jgi:hypothetical protein
VGVERYVARFKDPVGDRVEAVPVVIGARSEIGLPDCGDRGLAAGERHGLGRDAEQEDEENGRDRDPYWFTSKYLNTQVAEVSFLGY